MHTLDLVVLAAEWGHGRRQGWLSNLHLGARDPETDGFVMLGKTFKGLTDELLEWQTARLLELESRRDASTVYVHPQLVVEIAFDGIQTSPRYPGGVALRFARVLRYRDDKRADEADTIATVRLLHAARTARGERPASSHPAATSSTPSIVSTEPVPCTRVTRSPRWIRASATVTTGNSELSTAVIESSCSVVETE